ncbi:MAG: TIGR04283 family arsenosugar biosynthesis glycosyltransferase [Pseudomonadales bacterium]
MLISIIIPVLNEEKRLAALINYLRELADKQLPPLEIIVVDGGSTDASLSIAADLADDVAKTLACRAAQMNEGARLASGDVLVFLHADSWPANNLFSQCGQLIGSNRLWCFSKVRLDDEAFVFRVIEWFMNTRSTMSGIATGDQTVCVKSSTFDQLNGYADIPLMEDIELSRRLKRVSRPIVFDERVVCSTRKWRKNGVIKTVLMMWLLRAGYFLGTSPARLHAIYYG